MKLTTFETAHGARHIGALLPGGTELVDFTAADARPWFRSMLDLIDGGEPALTYTDVQDAADKIEYVLAHPEVQRSLRLRLAQRRALFSTERFMASMRQIVETFPPS